MLEFHNDRYCTIEYDPQSQKYAFQKNVIGPEAAIDIDEETYTPTDVNSIFVDSDTGADVNAGTEASPKLTLLASINACTSTKTKVLVLNTALYAEELDSFDNANFEGFYAASGETPTYTTIVLGYTPADANTIYVSADTGSPGATGAFADPFDTITEATTAVDAVKTSLLILDSATYTETAIEFTGNFKNLYAALGQNPTFQPTIVEGNIDYTASAEQVSDTEFTDDLGSLWSGSAGTLSNGNSVLAWCDGTLSSNRKTNFAIYNSEGGVVKAATEIDSTAPCDIARISIRSDDSFVVVWGGETTPQIGYFAIYDSSGVSVKTKTQFTADIVECDVSVMSNDYFVISYSDNADGDKMKFVIYDNDGIIDTAAATVDSSNCLSCCVEVIDSDEFVISWLDVGNSLTEMAVYNSAGALQHGPITVQAGSAAASRPCCKNNSDNEIIITWNILNFQYVEVYNDSLVSQHGPTTFDTNNAAFADVVIMPDDNIIISWNDIYGEATSNYAIYDKNLVNKKAKTAIYAAAGLDCSTTKLNSDNFVQFYQSPATGDPGYFSIITPYTYSGLLVSTNAIINGITIDCNDYNLLSQGILGNSSTISAKWLEIKDLSNPADFNAAIGGWAIEADDALVFTNCSIHDNLGGVYNQEDSFLPTDCLIYRNSPGYGLHIDGTAAGSGDITIDHCTIFANKYGLRLENNGGTNEIVKNSIFYDNDVYGINADVAMVYTYCLNTDTNNNASSSTGAQKANPLFINEGELVPADTDLQIKLLLLGYPANSPAYLLADDTTPDRDAGAWNVTVIGSATTWTSFRLEKPGDGIQPKHIPSGETETDRKDGSTGSDVEAWKEKWDLDFKKGIRNSEYDNIMLMMTCGNSQIRFYPDDTTNPNDYNVYNLIYGTIEAGAEHYKLTETGRQRLTISFERAYTA